MAHTSHVVHIEPHHVASGIWCDRCQASTVHRTAVVVVTTLRLIGRYETCERCRTTTRIT